MAGISLAYAACTDGYSAQRQVYELALRARGVTRNLLQGGPSQVLGGPVGKLEI